MQVFTALPAAEIIKLVSEKFANVANRHYTRLTTVQPSMQGSLLRKVCAVSLPMPSICGTFP